MSTEGNGAPSASDGFAHPVERELARVFDELGIAWEYEPHTIVLERDADGGVREAFTPDFYLPELDVYVECTVMRQPRTSRKRRKVRKAREAGLNVEVLFRRDFVRLARRWKLTESPTLLGETLPDVSASTGRGTETGEMHDAASELGGIEFLVEEEHPSPGTALFSVRGEADLHVAPDVRDRIAAAIADGASEVVVDLSDATFVDSMTLGVLLAAMKRLRARGGQLRLVVPRAEVRRIFEITLLDRVFSLYGTRQEALVAAAASDAL